MEMKRKTENLRENTQFIFLILGHNHFHKFSLYIKMFYTHSQEQSNAPKFSFINCNVLNGNLIESKTNYWHIIRK